MALSTTEAKSVLLSLALRDQIPLLELMKEAIEQGVDMEYTPPEVQCTAFEDNTMVELVRLPKICPCTKHLNNYYHHFQLYTSGHDPEISIWLVGT